MPRVTETVDERPPSRSSAPSRPLARAPRRRAVRAPRPRSSPPPHCRRRCRPVSRLDHPVEPSLLARVTKHTVPVPADALPERMPAACPCGAGVRDDSTSCPRRRRRRTASSEPRTIRAGPGRLLVVVSQPAGSTIQTNPRASTATSVHGRPVKREPLPNGDILYRRGLVEAGDAQTFVVAIQRGDARGPARVRQLPRRGPARARRRRSRARLTEITRNGPIFSSTSWRSSPVRCRTRPALRASTGAPTGKRRLLASADAATGARTPARRPRSGAARGGPRDERPGGDPGRRRDRQDAGDQPADGVRDRDRRRVAGPGARRDVHRQGRGRDGRAAAVARAAGRDRADVPRARAEPAAPLLAVAPRRAAAPPAARLQDPDPRPARAPAARATSGSRRRRTWPTRSSGRSRAGSGRATYEREVAARRARPRAADPGRPVRPHLRRTTSAPRPARAGSTSTTSSSRPSACSRTTPTPPRPSAPGSAGSASTSTRTRARSSSGCSSCGWATARTCASWATSTRRSTRSPAPRPTT